MFTQYDSQWSNFNRIISSRGTSQFVDWIHVPQLTGPDLPRIQPTIVESPLHWNHAIGRGQLESIASRVTVRARCSARSVRDHMGRVRTESLRNSSAEERPDGNGFDRSVQALNVPWTALNRVRIDSFGNRTAPSQRNELMDGVSPSSFTPSVLEDRIASTGVVRRTDAGRAVGPPPIVETGEQQHQGLSSRSDPEPDIQSSRRCRRGALNHRFLVRGTCEAGNAVFITTTRPVFIHRRPNQTRVREIDGEDSYSRNRT